MKGHKIKRYRRMKRAFDIGCSSVLLLLGMPLLLVVWLAVRLTSEGPAVFRQRRMGYRGRVFTMFKFRTMNGRHGEAPGPGRPGRPQGYPCGQAPAGDPPGRASTTL